MQNLVGIETKATTLDKDQIMHMNVLMRTYKMEEIETKATEPIKFKTMHTHMWETHVKQGTYTWKAR